MVLGGGQLEKRQQEKETDDRGPRNDGSEYGSQFGHSPVPAKTGAFQYYFQIRAQTGRGDLLAMRLRRRSLMNMTRIGGKGSVIHGNFTKTS
jgi:hypothetical protein